MATAILEDYAPKCHFFALSIRKVAYLSLLIYRLDEETMFTTVRLLPDLSL